MPINVAASSITVILGQQALFTGLPGKLRDTSLDQEFDVTAENSAGVSDRGVPVLTLALAGTWLSRRWVASPIVVTLSL